MCILSLHIELLIFLFSWIHVPLDAIWLFTTNCMGADNVKLQLYSAPELVKLLIIHSVKVNRQKLHYTVHCAIKHWDATVFLEVSINLVYSHAHLKHCHAASCIYLCIMLENLWYIVTKVIEICFIYLIVGLIIEQLCIKVYSESDQVQ